MTAVARGDGPTEPPDRHGTGGGDAVARALDPDGELRSAASDCVHCGFCLPACPTYQLWGEEMDSPRGRIHLISQVLEGAPVSEKVTMHLDRCLGCMACVTACPSGVRYNELIEAARAWPEQAGSGAGPVRAGTARTVRDKAVRAAIFATFPYPKRLRALSGPLRAAQRAGFDRLAQRGPLARYAPELAGSMRLAPRLSRPAGADGFMFFWRRPSSIANSSSARPRTKSSASPSKGSNAPARSWMTWSFRRRMLRAPSRNFSRRFAKP